MEIKNLAKNKNGFFCKKCDYFTSRKQDYNNHVLTQLHIRKSKISQTISLPDEDQLSSHEQENDASKSTHKPKSSQFFSHTFSCLICDYTTSLKQNFDAHNSTGKHHRKYLEMGNIRVTDTSKINYHCIRCNYSTIKKAEFEKHINTIKHLRHIDCTTFSCQNCNKNFANSSGLWKHKKKCKEVVVEKNTETGTLTNEMFLEFMKYSKDLQNFLCEQNKDLQNTLFEKTSEFQTAMIDQNNKIMELSKTQSTVINTSNTTNQQFNIQFFLNETCKDAMNITDFINSLQLQVEDFENTGKLGYIEGISRIIINGLNRIDTTKRPIHCTDVKRETLYVKDENMWEKEVPEKTKLKKAVNQVVRMNLSQLPKWQKENPASEVLDTKENNDYIKYSLVALGGKDKEEDDRLMEKIMKNVLKEVVIDKTSHLTNV
jgi:hypothetical protein